MSKKTDSDILSKTQVNDMMNQAMNQGLNDMQHADLEKTKKVLFFEVDAGTAGLIDGAWNVVSSQLMKALQPKTFNLAQKLGPMVGITGTPLNRVTAGAVLAINTGVVGSKFVMDIVHGHKKHFDTDAAMARKISPALDRLRKSHSILAYKRVGMDPLKGGNEVIYAHRMRSNKIADMENANNYLSLAINITPTVIEQLPGTKKMWAGTYDPKKIISKKSKAEVGDSMLGTMGVVAQGSAGPIAQRIIAKNQSRVEKKLQACSALEMIVNLQEQVEYDPKSSSFQLPKQSGGGSLGLEEYLARVLMQHQKDMADISPDHAELREALKDDISQAVKPVAEAIKKGQIDALALISLVGEQKIIKNKGRAIADADEVSRHIEQLAGVEHQPSKDPKEFYANASFTKEQFIAASKQLEGDELQRFLSLAPNEVLKEAGHSEKEIKEIRDATKARYNEILTQALLGLAAESDEQLKKHGMPRSEIKHLRKLEEAIRREGTEAVVTSKHGGAHALDGEMLVLNFAVPKVIEDKEYFGKLIAKGRDAMQKEPIGRGGDEDEDRPHRSHAEKYREREESRDAAGSEAEMDF